MDYSLGTRIGAILGSEDNIVKFLGYGIYSGGAVPVEAVGLFADIARAIENLNPCLELDNGKVVYGCECWWGSEEAVKQQLAEWQGRGLTVVEVDIDEVRANYHATFTGREDGLPRYSPTFSA